MPAVNFRKFQWLRNELRAKAYTMKMSIILRSDQRAHSTYTSDGQEESMYVNKKCIIDSFSCFRTIKIIGVRSIKERECVNRLVDTNMALLKSLLKSLPNFVQYCADRKNDLSATIRQFGKHTAFSTSAMRLQ